MIVTDIPLNFSITSSIFNRDQYRLVFKIWVMLIFYFIKIPLTRLKSFSSYINFSESQKVISFKNLRTDFLVKM